MKSSMKAACLAAVLGATAVLPAQAAIIGAVSGTINSGGPGSGTLTETLDQSGLSANYIPGVTDFDSFVATTTHTAAFFGNEWFGEEFTNSASVTYDLGSVKLINKMALWNEESSGIGLLDLLVSSDGVNFSTLLSGLMPTDNSESSYFADVFTFATTSFRYIQMDMSRCPQPLILASFESCAIGEVAFNQVAAIPVPAAGWLMIAGLGGLAALRRRKAA
jgi:hypothetical protein